MSAPARARLVLVFLIGIGSVGACHPSPPATGPTKTPASGACLATSADRTPAKAAPLASAPPARSAEPKASRSVDLPNAPPPLPAAKAPAASWVEDDLLIVVLTADGALFAAGERLPDDAALVPFAAKVRAFRPDVRARIDADAQVTYGRVVAIMDRLMQGGVTRIAFGVGPSGHLPRRSGLQ